MTKGVRVLSRLQLPPDTLARFRREDEGTDAGGRVLHRLQRA